MYEHLLSKDLLPTHDHAVQVADEIWRQLVMPIVRRPNNVRFDYWINSTKVKGIRALRIRVRKGQGAPNRTITSQAARDLLAQLPEGSWRVYTNNYWRSGGRVHRNCLVIYYRSDIPSRRHKFHYHELVTLVGSGNVFSVRNNDQEFTKGIVTVQLLASHAAPELEVPLTQVVRLHPKVREQVYAIQRALWWVQWQVQFHRPDWSPCQSRW
jgi:hypothetical protein